MTYKRPQGYVETSDSHVDFSVKAPAGTKLTLRTSGGNIDLKGFERGADASTSGGSLSTSGVKGDLSLHTSGGSVTIVDGEGTVVAETSGGKIASENVKGPQSLRTSGGAIEVSGAEGTVQASTSGGSVTIDGRLTGANEARSSGGSVTVRLPAGSNLTVSASGTSVDNEFGLPGRGQPPDQRQDRDWRRRLGGGDDLGRPD